MLQSTASVCGEFDNMHSDEQNQSLAMQSLLSSCILVHPLIFSVTKDYARHCAGWGNTAMMISIKFALL